MKVEYDKAVACMEAVVDTCSGTVKKTIMLAIESVYSYEENCGVTVPRELSYFTYLVKFHSL